MLLGAKNEVHDPHNYQFYVDTAVVEFKNPSNHNRKMKHAVIMLKNKKYNISIVHPLSSFVLWKWKYRKYNTQRLQAIHLCQFLNHVLIEKRFEYKLKSLSDIDFNHGTSFLNCLLAKQLNNKSVKNVERTLVHFYRFLAEKGCSRKFGPDQFIEKNNMWDSNRMHVDSPFHPRYSTANINPNKMQKPIEHTLPHPFIFPFLRTSIRVSPQISLGIYFAMFGGLRAGEVANIRVGDITPYGDSFGLGGIKINLQSRGLRRDIRDVSGSSEVKRERQQLIYNIKSMLPLLYEEHMKRNIKRYAEKCLSASSPLFIDRDGNAMTGKSIRYHFNKIKREFIEELSASENPEHIISAINLGSSKWSFHIGRGFFTNLIAKTAKNPYDVALARGDRSIFSALTYMADTEEMKDQIEKLLDEIFQGTTGGN